MAAKPVEFDPAAIEETQSSYRWYANRSERAAAGFLAELDRAVDAISSTPARCAPYMHGCQRYLMKRYPYLVVFRELATHIQVIAVAHGRRRPGYWRERAER